ncbi:hypothetical protein RhiirB3_415750 [Rhizophagus irregularis]|nr:hypothetical protein RhiirB3_415750 [Rhizophagus irregularis]
MILSRDLRKPLYKWNKRKANELDDDYDMDIVWGIVTDAEKWYFMECTLDSERKPFSSYQTLICCV